MYKWDDVLRICIINFHKFVLSNDAVIRSGRLARVRELRAEVRHATHASADFGRSRDVRKTIDKRPFEEYPEWLRSSESRGASFHPLLFADVKQGWNDWLRYAVSSMSLARKYPMSLSHNEISLLPVDVRDSVHHLGTQVPLMIFAPGIQLLATPSYAWSDK